MNAKASRSLTFRPGLWTYGLLLVCLGCASQKLVMTERSSASSSGPSKSNQRKDSQPQPIVQPVAFQQNEIVADSPSDRGENAPASGDVPIRNPGGAQVQAVESIRLGPVGAPENFAVDGLPVEGDDLASIEAMALASHPAVVEQRARVQAARGNWVQAGLPFNPVALYQAEEMGTNGTSGLHSMQISQTWVTANKLGLARGVASAEIRRAEAELNRAELQVLTAVRTAYIAALIAQQRVEQTAGLLDIANQSLESVDAMLRAAEVSRIAQLQAQTAADQAELAYDNAVANESAARRRLAAAVGSESVISGPLSGDLARLLPEMPWESLLAELVANSPERVAAGSELERARRALQLAVAQVTPNVTTWVGAGFDDGSEDAFATAGVSLPLPIRNRNQGNIARARAEIAAADAALGRTQLDLSRRLAEAVGRYRVARNRVEMLQQTVVPRAEETLELSREAFEAGEASFLELLTVQRTLSQTRLEVLDAVEQARTAAAEIDGMLVNAL